MKLSFKVLVVCIVLFLSIFAALTTVCFYLWRYSPILPLSKVWYLPLRIYTPYSKCSRNYICGQIRVNRAPFYTFRVEGDPDYCGMPDAQLSCENNRSVLYIGSGNKSNKYYVVADDDTGILAPHSLRFLDPGLQKNNCSTIPLYSLTPTVWGDHTIIFVTCRKPIKNPKYIDTAPCLSANVFSNVSSEESIYSYVVVGKALETVASDIEDTCTIHRVITATFPYLDLNRGKGNISFQDIHDALAAGFVINYVQSFYSYGLTFEILVRLWQGVVLIVMNILLKAIVGFALLLVFLIYKCRRRHLSIYDTIEEFLKSRNNLAPIRYSYTQIKKMTNNFKEKLGEGGYGLVYKGKLRSGQLVAVKILTKSKGNGQDFINEVATLGRIHHVNVVRLVGFCVEGSKCALVFDYMPNGSLDKFIFAYSPNDRKLDLNKSLQIATGVARGIEYLHQGCDMQILHFDIKPHNILLDENFVPKVSDFGLAKLRTEKNNVVTMTAARGTLGYMAPELFYKRVGNVSYKSDVYSFGMLLMEIAGGRRNLKANVERSSQIYFPSWIYDQFDRGVDVEFGDNLSEEEKGIAIKLVSIALWCIQLTPNDRPTMKEVVKMLQDGSNNVQLPPKPMFYPPDAPVVLEQTSNYSSTEESTERLCSSFHLEIEQDV